MENPQPRADQVEGRGIVAKLVRASAGGGGESLARSGVLAAGRSPRRTSHEVRYAEARYVAKLVRASAGGGGESLARSGVLAAGRSPRRTSHEVRYKRMRYGSVNVAKLVFWRYVAKLVRASAGGGGESLARSGVLAAGRSPRRTSHEVRYKRMRYGSVNVAKLVFWRHVAKLVRASAGGGGESLVRSGVLAAGGSPRRTSHEVRYKRMRYGSVNVAKLVFWRHVAKLVRASAGGGGESLVRSGVLAAGRSPRRTSHEVR